jgi:site-specific recombinase XerD
MTRMSSETHGLSAGVSGWLSAISGFELALTVEGLKAHTVSNYVRDVSRFASHVAGRCIGEVEPTDVREFLAVLSENLSAKTVHEAQLGLRRFFRFLLNEGDIANDPTRDVKLVRFEVRPQPTYTPQQVIKLIGSCDPGNRVGLRAIALVTVLYDTGVRAGELVSMEIPGWDRHLVRVDGKGGVRDVPLGSTSIYAIKSYVDAWPVQEGKLWMGKQGPLTGSGVHQLVRRLCEAAGVPDKGVHAFRRAAAAQMKRLGMQDSDILEVMGWKDVIMLRRYTAEVATELAMAAHARFSPGDSMIR